MQKMTTENKELAARASKMVLEKIESESYLK